MALSHLLFITAATFVVNGVHAACVSYGVDFQNGGTYFQNTSSTELFCFVQYFEGCQPDLASNHLVDPQGNQYPCSKTPLTPDDTNQLSTCPIAKDQLYSGPWSILVVSNNGDAEPIAFERDFSLIVGVATTSTYTPTLTVTTTTTPVTTKIITTATTASTTSTKTITSPSVTIKPTITITPPAATATHYNTTSWYTRTTMTVKPSIIKVTRTKTCSLAPPQKSPDPYASIAVKKANRRDASNAGTEYELSYPNADKEQWLHARRERLASIIGPLWRRGLDKATVTVTESDMALLATMTITVPASTTAALITTVESTVWSTVYTTTTVLKGTTTLKQQTVTAPRPTSTKTRSVVGFTTYTHTVTPTVTITIASAASSATAACKSAGGKLV